MPTLKKVVDYRKNLANGEEEDEVEEITEKIKEDVQEDLKKLKNAAVEDDEGIKYVALD